MEGIIKFFFEAKITQSLDGTMIIASSIGRYIAWACFIIGLIPFSIYLLKRKIIKWGVVGLGVSLVAVIIVIPGIMNEKIIIGKKSLKVYTGFWFSPTIKEIDFKKFPIISEGKKEINSNRTDTILILKNKEGQKQIFEIGDLFWGNRKMIYKILEENGIEISP